MQAMGDFGAEAILAELERAGARRRRRRARADALQHGQPGHGRVRHRAGRRARAGRSAARWSARICTETRPYNQGAAACSGLNARSWASCARSRSAACSSTLLH